SFFFSSRRRHTRFSRDWSSDVCSSDLKLMEGRSGATARYLEELAAWRINLNRFRVACELQAQEISQRLPLPPTFHLQKVDQHSAGALAQADLPRGLERRLPIDLDRPSIASALVTSGIHIDRGEGPHGLDQEIAAAGKRHVGL